MYSILIPTDFSESCFNAAKYAIGLANQINSNKIILYHAYGVWNIADPLNGYEQTTISAKYSNESMEKLIDFKNRLLPFAENIDIEAYQSTDNLADGLNNVCSITGANLIIMGLHDDGSVIKQTLSGHHIIDMAKHTVCPVILVPSKANFERIEEILLSSNFKEQEIRNATNHIANLTAITGAKLYVAHVQSPHNHQLHEKEETAVMMELASSNPHFYTLQHEDYIHAINDFAQEKEVDLLISISKRHSWFSGFFHKSHTKTLAFHSHLPLMILHD